MLPNCLFITNLIKLCIKYCQNKNLVIFPFTFRFNFYVKICIKKSIFASGMVSLGQKVALKIDECDVVKLVLEFLENRRIHISQVSLERETGLVNGAFSDDLIFLRQLILDGQWDSALQFVEPLKELEGFPSNRIRFLICKCKFFELLCIKQEIGPLQNSEFTVEEIVECLRELETLCENAEEFRKLCALLTLPKLSENEHFRSWNPYSARMDCFQAVLPLIADFIDGIYEKSNNEKHSTSDRLVQLIVRGLLYEYALSFCQEQALEGKNVSTPNERHFSDLLSHKEKLSSADLSLISWLETLGTEQFTIPFKQKEFTLRVNSHMKPHLEAQWSEQILATPIKPGLRFPYSMVPYSKPKFALKMMAHSMTASLIFDPGRRNPIGIHSRCNQAMSQSTLPSVSSFSIYRPTDGFDLGSDVMRQSQIISDMLSETSLNTLPSNPSQCKRNTIGNNGITVIPSSVICHIPTVTSESHQKLEQICQRNQMKLPLKPDKMSDHSLAPVPELDTPVGESTSLPFCAADYECNMPMVQSRLFQQFQAVKSQEQKQIGVGCFGQHSLHYANCYPMLPSLNNHCYPQNLDFQYSHPQQPITIRPNAASISNVHLSPMPNRPMSMTIPMQQVTMRTNDLQLTGQRPRSFLDKSIYSNQFSPDDCANVSVAFGSDQTKRSFDDDEPLFEDGDKTSEQSLKFVPICCYEDAQAIRAVTFHPSGGYFAIGTNSRNLLICRYQSNELHSSLNDDFLFGLAPPPTVVLSRNKHHRGSVYCAAFNQTGDLLATGSNDKTIKLMAVQIDSNSCRIGVEMDLQQVHDGTVRDLIFMEDRISSNSSCSTLISGGAGSCCICVTNCETGRTLRSIQEHTAPILGLYNWGSVNSFVSCSYDKTIRIWDLRASSATSVIWPTMSTTSSRVTSVCVDPSGKLLVSGHEDASVLLYDICGGRAVQIFRPHGDEVRTVRFSNAAYYLLSGSYDKRIVITDMRGNLAEPLPYLPVSEHRDKVIQCRWHPRDFVFLSTSADKTAVLWSLPSKSFFGRSHANL